MPRHRNPDYERTLTLRTSRNRLYASAKKLYTSDEDGKTRITDVYWGTLEELPEGTGEFRYYFRPNHAYMLLSQEERDNFIYPSDWDLTECEKLNQKTEDRYQAIISAVDESFLC